MPKGVPPSAEDYKRFVRDLMIQVLQNRIDVGWDEIVELAEGHSLIRWEDYDPENPDHAGIDSDLVEPGDPVWFLR